MSAAELGPVRAASDEVLGDMLQVLRDGGVPAAVIDAFLEQVRQGIQQPGE
jgi:hypothetical protein